VGPQRAELWRAELVLVPSWGLALHAAAARLVMRRSFLLMWSAARGH